MAEEREPDINAEVQQKPGLLRPWNAATIDQAAKLKPTDRVRAARRVRPAVGKMLTAGEVPADDADGDDQEDSEG